MLVQERKYGSWGWVDERKLLENVLDRPLTDVPDDSRALTINLMAGPNVQFDPAVPNPITYPSEALVGHIFNITFVWRNIEGAGVGTGFYRLSDIDTGAEVAYGTFPVAVSQAGTITIFGLIMPNRNWNLMLELGHVE